MKSFSKPRKSENRLTQKTGRKTVCPVAHAPGAPGEQRQLAKLAKAVSKGGERSAQAVPMGRDGTEGTDQTGDEAGDGIGDGA